MENIFIFTDLDLLLRDTDMTQTKPTTDEHLPIAIDRTKRDEARMKVLRARYRRRPWDVPHDLIMDSMERHKGKMNLVAEELDISFTMLASYVDKNSELQTLLMCLKDDMVDEAEEVLRHHLGQRSLKAAQFTLQTLGKERGYVRRDEKKTATRVVEERTLNVNLDNLTTEQLRDLRAMSEAARSPIGDSRVIDHDPRVEESDSEV